MGAADDGGHGFAGPVMAYMLASSDAQYGALGHGEAGWADLEPGGFDFDM